MKKWINEKPGKRAGLFVFIQLSLLPKATHNKASELT